MSEPFHQYTIYALDEEPIKEKISHSYHHRAFHSNIENTNTNKLNRVPSSQEMLEVLQRQIPKLKERQSSTKSLLYENTKSLLYERQMSWLKQVSKKKDESKTIQELQAKEECTFKPNLKSKDKSPFFKGERLQRNSSYKQLYTRKTSQMR